MSFERTEKPTPRRRRKAREQGQVVRSRELPAALAIFATVFLLAWNSPGWLAEWKGFFQFGLDTATQGEMGLSNTLLVLGSAGRVAFRLAAPVVLLAWAAAVLGLAAQGGAVLAPAALLPRAGKLSPASNLRKMFSFAGLSRVLRSLVPVLILGALFVDILSRDWIRILAAPRSSLGAFTLLLFGLLYELAWKAGVVFLLWGAADYVLQYWNHESRLRMTKQEVKDERRDTEGSEAVRGRRRRLRREWRRQQAAPAKGA